MRVFEFHRPVYFMRVLLGSVGGFAIGMASFFLLVRDAMRRPLEPEEPVLIVAVLLALFVLPIVGGWLGARWPRPFEVIVGSDGVLVRGRFTPHSKILHVRQGRLEVEHTAQDPHVSLKLTDRERVTLVPWDASKDRDEVSSVTRRARLLGPAQTLTDERAQANTRAHVAELVAAIDEASAAWSAGVDVELEMPARRGQDGARWLEELRRFGGDRSVVYRGAVVDLERLSRLLDDPRARPSARAAASVALTRSGDVTAAAKLRITAKTMVSPRLRVALEIVADSGSDLAVGRALETLDEADHEKREV